jgi:hypothetical protein
MAIRGDHVPGTGLMTVYFDPADGEVMSGGVHTGKLR